MKDHSVTEKGNQEPNEMTNAGQESLHLEDIVNH